MAVRLEYHKNMRRSISASLVLFGMLALPLILVSSGSAQVNSGSSMASASSAGHITSTSHPPPTSFGPFAPPTSGVNLHSQGFHSELPHTGDHHRHHFANSTALYPYLYPVPVPYAVDGNDADSEDDESDYQGGPTVFDRRGSGRESYVQSTYPGPAHAAPVAPADDPPAADPPAADPVATAAPEPPPPASVLVFRDGHQIEVGNYAIVGQTLYDLTPGHPRKIALADLDLSATEKQNDDRGIAFQLPVSAQAN